MLVKIHEGLIVIEEASFFFLGGDSTTGYIDITLGCLFGWLRSRSIALNANFFYESKALELSDSGAERFFLLLLIKMHTKE